MLDRALTYANKNRESFLDELLDLLRIPSISTLPEHKDDVQRAAEWLAGKMREAGLENIEVMPTGGNPLVYGDWLHAGDDALTILVYGHYDVQPVDPLDLWDSDPFEPVVRDGDIYARGATDDKGQMYMHVKAVQAMLTAGDLPLNVKFAIEGEEEIGSPAMAPFVEANKDRLAADLCLVSDTAFLKRGLPLIVYGLRGIVGGEIHISGPKRDLHSGAFGGTVHNPAQALCEIITDLHDKQGRVTVPGFYDDVRPLSNEEQTALADVPFDLALWQDLTGLEKPWGEPEFTLLERIGARPTCEVNGMWGGFQGEGGKTIIPRQAGAKITMRLVPDQDPDKIGEMFEQHVMDIAPDDVVVKVEMRDGGWPLLVAFDSAAVKAAARAYEESFGMAPAYMRGGGSIPILAMFQQAMGVPVVLMGFGLPEGNAHAPNEFYPVEHFEKGIEALIRYYYYVGKGINE